MINIIMSTIIEYRYYIMYVVVTVFVALTLTSCSPDNIRPVDNPSSVVHLNLQRQPPLNLSRYKNITYIIIEHDNTTYSCVKESDVESQMELLLILRNRIQTDESMLDQYRKYYGEETAVKK